MNKLLGVSDLLEGNYTLLTIKIPRRFLSSFLTVLAVKLVLTVTIYLSLKLASIDSFWMDSSRMAPLIQNRALSEGVATGSRWAYTFLGWDSAWYLSIMEGGYTFSTQSYAFFPIFPVLGRFFYFLLGSPVEGLAACSLLFGVLWVPLYQALAESYLERKPAFISALLFAVSPFALIFTTVGYSEGVFLFTTIGAYLLFVKGKRWGASFAAAIATLVRPPGFLITLPMFMAMYKRGSKWDHAKAFSVFALPFTFFLLWLLYSWVISGDPIASFHTSEWSTMYTFITYFCQILPKWGLEALLFPVAYLDIHWLTPFSIWSTLILLPIIIWRIKEMNNELAFYCLTYTIGILAFGSIFSLPRYVAVLFPLWIPITAKISSLHYSKILLTIMMITFIAVTGILWVGFINGTFIA